MLKCVVVGVAVAVAMLAPNKLLAAPKKINFTVYCQCKCAIQEEGGHIDSFTKTFLAPAGDWRSCAPFDTTDCRKKEGTDIGKLSLCRSLVESVAPKGVSDQPLAPVPPKSEAPKRDALSDLPLAPVQ